MQQMQEEPVAGGLSLVHKFISRDSFSVVLFVSAVLRVNGVTYERHLKGMFSAERRRVLHLPHRALNSFHQIRFFFLSLLPCSCEMEAKALYPLVMNEWMNLLGLCLPVLWKKKKKLLNSTQLLAFLK